MWCSKCNNTYKQGTLFCPTCKISLGKRSWWRRIPGFRTKTWWKMLIACFLYTGLLALLVVQFLPGDSPDAGLAGRTAYPSVRKQLEISIIPTDAQDSEGNSLIGTHIRNNSPYIVTGNVFFTVLDANHKVVSQNIIPFEEPTSTSAQFVPSWLPTQGMASVEQEVFITNVSLPPTTDTGAFQTITKLPADDSATQALRSYLQQYFGGAGGNKPTGWYSIIETITVYNNGSERIAVVKTKLVQGNNTPDALNGLQAAVIGFAADSANQALAIMRVDVFDALEYRISSKINPAL